MIKINLIAETRRAVATRKAAPKLSTGIADLGQALLVGLLVLGLLVAAGWWYLLQRDVKRLQEEVRVAQQEVDRLAPVLKEVEEYKAKKAELERKIGVITDLRAARQGKAEWPEDLTASIPGETLTEGRSDNY